MDKRKRAYRIYQAGVAEMEPDDLGFHNTSLLRAIAAMIDYATNKNAGTKRKPAKPLLYTEAEVLQCLNYDNVVVTEPGKLDRVFSRVGQEPNDVVVFERWWTKKKYKWMQDNNVDLTYQLLCRKWPEWLACARQFTTNEETTTEQELTRWR